MCVSLRIKVFQTIGGSLVVFWLHVQARRYSLVDMSNAAATQSARFAAIASKVSFQEFALRYCAEKTQGRRRPVGPFTVRAVNGHWSVGNNGDGGLCTERDASTAYGMLERSPLRALAMEAEELRYSILCPAL